MLERARVVIGADGRSSKVARAVGAERYNEKPKLQWSYYTYWSGLAGRRVRDRDPARSRLGSGSHQRRPHDARRSDGPSPRPRRTRPTSRATTSRRWSWRPSSPSESAPRPGRSGSREARARTSSASRSAPGGRSSGMPATTRTRSPPRASATHSATPSCAPGRWTRPAAASVRSRTRWAPISSCATPT